MWDTEKNWKRWQTEEKEKIKWKKYAVGSADIVVYWETNFCSKKMHLIKKSNNQQNIMHFKGCWFSHLISGVLKKKTPNIVFLSSHNWLVVRCRIQLIRNHPVTLLAVGAHCCRYTAVTGAECTWSIYWSTLTKYPNVVRWINNGTHPVPSVCTHCTN